MSDLAIGILSGGAGIAVILIIAFIIAAERLERNYIVGDISKKYLKVAKRRIENEVNRII